MIENRFHIVGFIFSLVFFSWGACFAETVECDFCKKIIDGKYYIYNRGGDEFVVCQECREKSGACTLCGVPVFGTKPDQKNVLCEVCRQEARFCSLCSQLIREHYYTDSFGFYYCSDCMKKAARCDSCNRILRPGEWQTDHQYKLCDSCAANVRRCHSCGVPLLKSFISYSGFSEAYCAKCSSKYPKCTSCGRPAGPGSLEIEKKHWICPDCLPTAVTDREELTVLAKEIRNHLEINLLMMIQHQISIDFAGANSKHELSSKESGRFTDSGGKYSITIKKGLRRSVCIETLAHEFAHAWQCEEIPGLRSEKWREGFAQWVAAQVLTDYGLKEEVARIEQRDDLYGRGYSLIKEIEEKEGIETLFKRLRKQGRN